MAIRRDVSMSIDLIIQFDYPSEPKGTGYIWVHLMDDSTYEFRLPSFEQIPIDDSEGQRVYVYSGHYFNNQDSMETYVNLQVPKLVMNTMARR